MMNDKCKNWLYCKYKEFRDENLSSEENIREVDYS